MRNIEGDGMAQNFSTIMDFAIKRCEGIYVDDGALKNMFHLIYPFTTENISGYISEFDLQDKSLLTVGSSGDQVINAILKACKDISVLDVNPYTKFYYYLKVASILSLDLDEFMRFLRFKDYPKVFKNNKDVFSKDLYNKVKLTLRLLDYETYLFWDELFCTFSSIDIRNNLFSLDENRTYVILGCNPYLQSSLLYAETKKKIKNIRPNFLVGDLFNLDLQGKYDNIWLSNIGTYHSRHLVKIMTDKLVNLLNIDGKLLISYLYKTTIDTKYEEGWEKIYDLDKIFNMLKEYSPILKSFIGVDGIKFNDQTIKDSILVYRKH